MRFTKKLSRIAFPIIVLLKDDRADFAQQERLDLRYWTMGKVPNWECLFVSREKGLFLSLHVDDIKMARKTQHLDPMWKILMKEVDLGEPTSVLWPCLFGLHFKRMQNKQRYCGQLQRFVWIQDFSWRVEKLLQSEESEANISSSEKRWNWFKYDVHVQWYYMVNSTKWRKLRTEFNKGCNLCQKVSMVISGTWLWTKWYGTHVNKPNGEWNRVAAIMMINFAQSGHPVFEATSPLERGELKRKGGGKKTIHNNGSEETVELILRTVFLSIGSVSTEQSQICATNDIQIMLKIKSVNRWWHRLRVPTQTPHLRAQHHRQRETLLQDYFKKFAELLEKQKLSKLCKDAGFLKKIPKGWGFADSMSRMHVWRHKKYTRSPSRATGPWSPRKNRASMMADISAVLLDWVLAPVNARWASVVMTRPNKTSILPWRDHATALHPACVSP